jgi:hypothetical protein
MGSKTLESRNSTIKSLQPLVSQSSIVPFFASDQRSCSVYRFRGSAKRGRGWIGLVTGLDMAFGRLFISMDNATAIPITDSTGQWYWAFGGTFDGNPRRV